MTITDNTLQGIKNSIDSTTRSYFSDGRMNADECKLALRYTQRDLNNKIAYQENALIKIKAGNDITRTNAYTIASSKDFGMIKTALENALINKDYSFVSTLSDLVINSKDSFSDSEKYKAKCFTKDCNDASGYTKEKDILGQAKVINSELEAYLDAIGTMGQKDVLSKVYNDVSKAEFNYLKEQDKLSSN